MSDRAHSRTILRQVVETIGAYGSQELMAFLGVILYAQLVTSAVLGRYFLFVSIVNVAAFLGLIGVNTHLEREIGRNPDNGALLAAAGAVLLGLIFVFTVAAMVASPFVTDYFEARVIPLLVIGVAVRAVTNLYGAVLRGEKRAPLAQTLVSLERLLTFGIGAALVIGVTDLGLSPFHALGVAYLASTVVHLVVAFRVASVYPTTVPSLSSIRSLLRKTKFISVSQIYSQGQQWVDTLLIGYFLGPTPVAIYEIAWRISGAAILMFNTLYSVLFPRLSEWVAQGNSAALSRYATELYYYSLMPVYALLAGGAVTGDALLGLIYGTTYAAGLAPLVILLFGRLFHTLERASSTLLFAIDEERTVARISVLGLAVNVLLNLLLIPTVGVMGAAAATSSAFVVGGLIKWTIVRRRISINPLWRANGIAIAGAAAMATVLWLSRRYLADITDLLDLGVFVLMGALLYAVFLIMLDPRVRRRVLTIRGQL